jgi:uncharacterized protein
MIVSHIILASIFFLIISILYSSVGHAGASGYLAVMALLSFAPETIKPTSLILNVVVASIASVKYIKADCFDKRVFLAFILTSLPMAFIGGYITISPRYFKLIAGLFLVISSLLLIIRAYYRPLQKPVVQMPFVYGLIGGSLIGLISGLIGVGGGIFLSPIIIMANWTTVRNASGVAALFILLNSLAGLAGHILALNTLDHYIFYWIIAVVIGGLIGSFLGTIKFNNKIIITCLFLVLLSAGLKFLLIDFLK